MKDVRENEQLNTELLRHDEIFKALAELTSAVKSLESKMKEFEPAMEYINKGSVVAKFLLSLVKLSAATVVGAGGVAGAWMVIRSFIHGSN